MLGVKSRLRGIVRWFVYKYAEKLSLETERVYWILINAVMERKLLLTSVFVLGFIGALIEGGSAGVLALAVTSITGDEELSLLNSTGRLGEYALDLRGRLGKEDFFFLLVGVAISFQILRAGLQYLLTVATAYLTTYSTKSVQERVVNQIMAMSLSQVTQYPAGILQAGFRNASNTGKFILTLSNFILTMFVIAVYILLVFWVSPWLTVASLALCGAFYVSLSGLVKKIKVVGWKYVDAMKGMQKHIMELLYAPKLLRAYGHERFASRTLVNFVEKMQAAQRRRSILKGIVNPLSDVSTVIIGGSVLVGGYYIAGGSDANALSTILAFIFVLYRFMGKITELTNVRTGIMGTLPAAEAVAELLRIDNKDFTRRGGRDVPPLRRGIQFEDVSFSYNDDAVETLNKVSFTIPKGSFVAVVGASGSGKSTLVNLLLGLFDPSQGSIRFDDLPIGEANLVKWRKRFALVSQDTVMFHASVRDNIEFGAPGATDEAIVEASKLAFCHEFIDDLEDKYDYVIGDQGHRLSGGQVQRLALARALVRGADVLILDEATSALDSISEQSILQTLELLRKNLTIVSIAHRLSTIMNADIILVMKDGAIIESGTHAELLQNGANYKALWDMQTHRSNNRTLGRVGAAG